MSTLGSGFKGTTAEKLTAEVRQYLSRRLIERTVHALGMKEIFFQSQSWKGYDRACNSWHDAYWKWVAQETPADLVERLQIDWSKLRDFDWTSWSIRRGFDPSTLPCAEDEKKLFLVEVSRQEYLQRRAFFLLSMRGPEATDPQTYKEFFDDMQVAKQIGDDSYFEALAKQKERKPTKDSGDRRLKYQLLLTWIPGCLWAFTTDGIAQFLNAHYPRSSNKLYNNKTISDARRDLKLYRPAKPLWWGLADMPPGLVPLR